MMNYLKHWFNPLASMSKKKKIDCTFSNYNSLESIIFNSCINKWRSVTLNIIYVYKFKQYAALSLILICSSFVYNKQATLGSLQTVSKINFLRIMFQLKLGLLFQLGFGLQEQRQGRAFANRWIPSKRQKFGQIGVFVLFLYISWDF